ncbi:MAG: protein translocase subunit SecF [Myxococcota bacterium]|nr:protein translocase subunit SecF [Myxococcota bacterium]
MNFLKPKKSVDFVGMRKIFGAISALLVLVSLVLTVVVQPNWGIDFTGGTEITVKFDEDISIGEVRTALTTLGLGDDAVQQINDEADHEFSIRVRDTTIGAEEVEAEVLEVLAQNYGADFVVNPRLDAQVSTRVIIEHKPGVEVDLELLKEQLKGIEGARPKAFAEDNTFQVELTGLSAKIESNIKQAFEGHAFEVRSVDSVGPKVGGDLRTQGILAMAATLGLILLYIAFRFDVVFAPGAILALIHDVALTLGLFTVFQLEVNLSMIGALLTIIGYSLNDTIVIYDRIRENMRRYRRSETEKLINDSINDTLGRTLATSITTLFGIIAFLVLGGPVIRNFALAMGIGVVVGTYSTIFVATPSILVMEKVKPVLVKWLTPATPGVVIEGQQEATQAEQG